VPFVLVVLAAMLTKAGLIATYFMHLRWERVVLAWMVLIGRLLNGTILYALMVPDAYRRGALFLLAVSFITFGTIASLAIRRRRRAQAAEGPESPSPGSPAG